MSNRVQITEEDIFRFVYFPKDLSTEKINYISENSEEFKPMIVYYQSFNNPLSAEESDQIKFKIEERFNFTHEPIHLFPTMLHGIQNESGLRLAAASTILEKKSGSLSLSDPGHKYLIRLVQSDNTRLLYLLPNVSVKHSAGFEVVIHPSAVRYTIRDLSSPIEIQSDLLIDSIEIIPVA